MIPTLAIALLLAAAGSQDAGAPFRLAPGDYRWQEFSVRHVPMEVDSHFDVLSGNPKVHLELMPEHEFRLFERGQEHETMAVTPDGRDGGFRRIIDSRGKYAIVIENARDSGSATVRLHIRTNLNPGADVAETLSPRRRLAVIGLSFAFFFATVAWSGRKLFRAMRHG